MSGGEEDLTGTWHGFFHYPDQFPPNEFQAELNDIGGTISGLITQPGEFFYPPGTILQAVVEGQREGSEVSFIKIYDDLERPTPHYRGSILPGGDEVQGEWTIPGDWSGTFFMIRGAGAKAGEEKKVSEEVR
ncbi:MAG TPA: hypothetical protein VLK25_08720 [Allosphingosinicella sp.]|nr:hypothetical protein [Allosphingosinicella sp.]